MAECNICADMYTKQSRRKITCSSCNHECCSVCFETYLSTSKLQPQCMQCHRPWDLICLKENLTTASIKRITETKKQLLLQEQKCLIPHTIEYVNLNDEDVQCNREMNDVQVKIKELQSQIYEIERRRQVILRQKNVIQRNFLTYRNLPSIVSVKTKEDPVYIRPCNKDECKGYVTNKGVCGICKTKYCKKCLVECAEDHECDANDVLSIEMIKKDSKSCPNCTTLIHRISGCPDMFCVSCHTAFNWNNLKIDMNGNSNPLYYKWMREGTTGANLLDVAGNCENLHITSVFRSNNFMKIKDNKIRIDLDKIMNSLDHTRRNMSVYYQALSGNRGDTNFETLTLDARVKYMTNEITEKHFMTQLMRIHKANEYNNNISQSENLLNGYLNDMKRNIVYSENFDANVCIQEFVNFANYMNECVSHLRNVFYKKTTFKDITSEKQTTNFITIPEGIH